MAECFYRIDNAAPNVHALLLQGFTGVKVQILKKKKKNKKKKNTPNLKKKKEKRYHKIKFSGYDCLGSVF